MHATRTLFLILPLLVIGTVLWSISQVRARGPAASAELPQVLGTGFPRQVVLPDGTQFTLPEPPARVVLANTSVFDMAVALLPIERIAALPDQMLLWSAFGAEAKRFAAIPQFSKFTVEDVLMHRPDLVLCGAYNLPETTVRLRSLGVPVVAMPLAEDYEGILDSLTLLGRLFGEEERAADLLAQLDQRVQILRNDSSRRHLRAMSYVNPGTGGFTSGRGTLVDTTITLAGMQNLAAASGHVGDSPITYEELLVLDPDIIIVGVDTSSERSASDRMLREDPILRQLRAVREDRIVPLHRSHASSASQEIVKAAETLAEAVDGIVARVGR